MSVINTNTKSIVAQNALTVNNRAMSKAMEQLSTGKRINSAADDAAGLAISSKMTSQIKGLNQAVRNANDGISLVQTAEGALVEVTNMLQRMRELSVQSANDTNTTDDRSALDLEFQELKKEINRIGNNTQWNGTNVLDKSFANESGEFKFQVGANSNQTISMAMSDFRTEGKSNSTGVTALTSSANVSKVAQVDDGAIIGDMKSGNILTITSGSFSYAFTATADLADGTAIATAIAADSSQAKIDFQNATGINITASPTAGSLRFTSSVPGVVLPAVTATATVSTGATGAPSLGAATPVTANGTGTAQISTLTLSGGFTAGDLIKVGNATGSSSFSYEVTSDDVVADASATRANIAVKLAAAAGANGTAGTFANLSNTNVQASTSTVTFTADTPGTANGAFTLSVTKGSTTGLKEIQHSAIKTQPDANLSIKAIDSTLATVNTARAEMGATINRLNFAADNLTNVSQNASESRSRIQDTDYAQTTTELARTQIISQAATAMLAQANQAPQSVLSLLR